MENWTYRIIFVACLMMGISSIGTWVIIPEMKTLNLSLSLFSLFLLLFVVYLKRAVISSFLKTSRFKSICNALVQGGLILAIFAMINFMSYKKPIYWDFSAHKINSLTDSSKKIISDLSEVVTFKLFSNAAQKESLRPFLELYRLDGLNTKIEYFDPESSPAIVEKYGLRKKFALVVESDKGHEVLEEVSETQVSGALLNLSRDRTPVIYFLEGHGESSIANLEENGLSTISQELEDQRFTIKTISLLEVSKIPDDASLVIMLGPLKELRNEEVQKIDNYLAGGGNFFLGIAPILRGNGLKTLTDLFQKYGVNITNSMVIDNASQVSGSKGMIPLLKRKHKNHEIVNTTDLKKEMIFFPISRALFSIQNTNLKVSSLLETSAGTGSWAESSIEEILNNKIYYSIKNDVLGPLTVLMSSENEKNNQKILISGSANFVNNQFVKLGGNLSLFLKSMKWMTNTKVIISREKTSHSNELKILSNQELGLVFFVNTFGIPFVFMGMALALYMRKRHS